MYYPKQIPYLLNEDFRANVDYTEYKDIELDNYCLCIWYMKSKKYLNEKLYNNILPDACIDLIIDFTTKEIYFSGFSRSTEMFELNNEVNYLGVRFKPGAFYELFNINADNVMDSMIYFSEIEENDFLNNIFCLDMFEDKLLFLKDYLYSKIKNKVDMTFIEFVDKLYEMPSEKRVSDIAKALNYNERQLLRIFMKHYGISPKVLLNILRLHLCLTLLFDDKKTLSDIASTCGFYDQAHFIKEVKKYTGISPIKLLDIYKK